MPLKNVADIYPLSPMQRLMLMSEAAESDHTLLVNRVCYELRGTLQVPAFREAWERLVARHAALRTAVLWDRLDQPVQVVREGVTLPFQEIDLSTLAPSEARARLHELTRADARHPFDLATAPLMRVILVRVSEGYAVFVLDIHHMVVDRWSQGTLLQELGALYQGLVEGTTPRLAPSPDFRDYIAWVARQGDTEAERFWRRELRGFVEPTPLAASEQPLGVPLRRATRGDLTPDVTTLLRERAAGWKVTPASLVMAALGLELARRKTVGDVAFGLTVSGRPAELEGIERMVGTFVNNVPVRLRLEGSVCVEAWVRDIHVRQVARQPFDHVSLAAILDVSDLRADQRPFDVLLVPNLGKLKEPEWPGLEMSEISATFDAGYPFVLGVGYEGPALGMTLVHDDAFGEATDVLQRITELLEALIRADADTTLGDLLPSLASSTQAESAATRHEFDISPAPEASDTEPLSTYVLRMWRDVLGVDDVDLDADFFALGGTSLQAAQILRRIEQRVGHGVSLSVLFEAGTMRGLLESLSEVPEVTASTDLRHVERDGRIPLSFAQERLWVLDHIERASSLYNVPAAYRLSGPLQTHLLRRSLETVVARHETLRSRYAAEGGVPYVVIDSPASFSLDWDEIDLRDEAGAVDPAVATARVDAEAAAPIDLEEGPLFRVRLYRLGRDEHVLLFVIHHSVSDAWSVGVLEREVSTAYTALTRGEAPALPELPIQVADVAAWQREQLRGAAFDEQVAYWRERLADMTPVELPADRLRPAIQTFRGGVLRTRFGAELLEGLRQVGRAEGATLFMTLMAAFHVLLHRYSGATDVTVGTPYSGRNRIELEGLIGMFVNTILIRTEPSPDMTFRALLDAVREASTEAYGRSELPFEGLVEALQPERDLSRNPLFQVLLALQDVDRLDLSLSDLRAERFVVQQDTAKLDLSLYLQETLGEDDRTVLEGVWEYATDLFDEATVRGFQRHLTNLLEAIVSDPTAPISALPMLDPDERASLLGTDREAAGPDPAPLFLERFRKHVEKTPDRNAISDGAGSLAYRDLEARANRLAHRLIARGAAPETLVGIHLDRSNELIVALLAVLKAGAGYLPLDPEHPADRLAYMLDHSDAAVLVTTSDLLGALPGFRGQELCLDRDAAEIDAQSASPPAVTIGRDHLAYTIYTSGSTGRPKGVQVTHGNLAHLIACLAERPGLTADEVVLARSPVAFDMSVVEVFAPLALGAHMVVAGANDVATGSGLIHRIEESGVTLVEGTPATFHMLFEAGWAGGPSLTVYVGGEALSLELAQRLVDTCSEVWNLYGPTEATVWASCWRIPPDVDQVRIGTPMGATAVLTLDARMEPVPVGVVGELYIGGPGVARGYRNAPELTEHGFVPNPFGEVPGDRLYRTGDLARWRHDRNLEFVGRQDHQVQLRGFRIELGEIEAVLAEHDGIQRAVVDVVDGGTPDARLVAYMMLERGTSLTVSDVRRYLRGRLPRYMVPGLVQELSSFPTTPNGKIDRNALPALLAGRPHDDESFSPPKTPTEVLLAEVWASLLGVPRIGRHDNFFQLGGHSLLSLRAVAELEESHGRSLDPRAMFFQTLEQLAAQLDGPTDER